MGSGITLTSLIRKQDGQLHSHECSVGLKNRLFCRYIGHLGPVKQKQEEEEEMTCV